MEIKEKILEEYRNGNIIFLTHEGYMSAKLEKFVEQPIDGLLYDLNRLPEVIMTWIDDPKWVNDYAMYAAVKYLHRKVDELTGEIERMKKEREND